jgi:hypothetical protein
MKKKTPNEFQTYFSTAEIPTTFKNWISGVEELTKLTQKEKYMAWLVWKACKLEALKLIKGQYPYWMDDDEYSYTYINKDNLIDKIEKKL